MLVAFLILGIMKFGVKGKRDLEQAENRGKLMIYEVQEVEALRKYSELQIIKDSIQAYQDSLIRNHMIMLNPEHLQSQLDSIFNY